MPRTPLTYSQLVGNGAAAVTPTTIDQSNGMSIALSDPEQTILVVANSDAAAHNVTIKAGDPLLGLGTWPDNVFSVPAASTRYLGPFESARVSQKDRSVWIDFAAGFAGTIVALHLPKGV